MLKLALRNLLAHPARSFLTIAAFAIAIFLVCFLSSLLTALEAGSQQVGVRRLWTQTAVSLFATMPQSYESKIEALPSVESAMKFQWFGGVYKDPQNFFGQFAVDAPNMIELYPEIEMVEGDVQSWYANRRGAIIGDNLQKRFPEMQVGSVVPLIGSIFPKLDGSAWELEVVGVYTADEPYVDRGALFFHWEFLNETMSAQQGFDLEVGTYCFEPVDGADLVAVSGEVDELFASGPMRTQTNTESEFNRQFIGMFGSLPTFLGFLGTGVFFSILLACLNTMLMASREQTNDVGVLKALGFGDGQVFGSMFAQGLVLCCAGGLLGVALAKVSEPVFGAFLASMFPGFTVTLETIGLALVLTLAVGLVAGAIPALIARRMRPVDALRTTI